MRACQRAAHGAALFYVLSALPVLACPVADDLSRGGVVFTTDAGEQVVHSRLDAIRTQADWSPTDRSFVSRSILIHGTFVQEFGDVLNGVIDPNTRGLITRPMAAEATPMPRPGLAWAVEQTFTDANGSFGETLSATVAEPTKVRYGACEYEAFPVTMVIGEGDGQYTEEVTYFPSLGTGILVAVTDQDGRFTYDYTEISVAGGQ